MSLDLTPKQLEYLINILYKRITELNENEIIIQERFNKSIDNPNTFVRNKSLNDLTKLKVQELYNKLKNERAKYN